MKKIVVVGATSVLAEHCCRLWVLREACDLLLIARDGAKAGRIAEDLRVRSPASRVEVLAMDFLETASIGRVAEQAAAAGAIDIVLIAHGMMPDQRQVESDLTLCREMLEINAVSPALFAEAFARQLARAGRGSLAIIGSVAGDRARRLNYTYGASKGFLGLYAQGMDHRFAGTGISVVLIKPGPTDTPLAAPAKAAGRKMASPEEVAQVMVRGIDARKPVVYAPARWALIMFVVRSLPRIIFNRLNL